MTKKKLQHLFAKKRIKWKWRSRANNESVEKLHIDNSGICSCMDSCIRGYLYSSENIEI